MNDISEDDNDDAGMMDIAKARDSDAMQAFLRYKKLSGSDTAPTPLSHRSRIEISPSADRDTPPMHINDFENTLTMLSPGLRVNTSLSSSRIKQKLYLR